jgi:hypothetical protein
MSTNKQVFVRVHLKKGIETFHRCGMSFSRDWRMVKVGDAELQRLYEEQMLEVVSEQPSDYIAPAAPAAAAAPAADATVVAPTDATERLTAITAAIAKLDKADATFFTKDGVPTAPAISAIVGWAVSAAERTLAWDAIVKAAV